MEEGFQILVVDDNKDLADNFIDILNSHDYKAVGVHDGKSALNVLKDHQFDFGLIDFKLPDCTGMELIKKILKVRPHMEFIIVTGHGTLDSAIEAVSLKEIIGFKSKPVDIDQILALIKQVFLRRNLEKSLQESKERYRDLFDHSLTGINITTEHKIKVCNQKMADIFGYENSEDLINKDISELIHPEDMDYVRGQIQIRESGESDEVRYECRGIRQDGSTIDIEVLGRIVQYRGENSLQGTILDITARKEAERELLMHKNSLEETIRKRTVELAKKNEDLQNFNKLFVGREKRIKELKDQLRILKNEE